MASVFRKTYTKPLPNEAEIFTRKGERFARWKDSKGKSRTAPLTTGRDGSDRIVLTSSTYTAKYRDADDIVREVATGCRTKDGAVSVLKDLTNQAERVRSNILTASEAAISEHHQTVLTRHFDTFLTHLQAKGDSDVHIADTKRLATCLFNECRFRLLRDIHRDAVERWLVDRKVEGMAARTRNSYLQAIRGFCNWCVQTDRMLTNPLSKMKQADEKSDRRRQRRSMTETELHELLFVAKLRPLAEYSRLSIRKKKSEIKGKRDTWKAAPLTLGDLTSAVERARERLQNNTAFIDLMEQRGRERALVYKAFVLTGLRRSEMASLSIGQLNLDGPVAYVVLEAADEKNREGSDIPL